MEYEYVRAESARYLKSVLPHSYRIILMKLHKSLNLFCIDMSVNHCNVIYVYIKEICGTEIHWGQIWTPDVNKEELKDKTNLTEKKKLFWENICFSEF